MIVYQGAAIVVGRQANSKDQAFYALVHYWHQQWIKEGSPLSNQGY